MPELMGTTVNKANITAVQEGVAALTLKPAQPDAIALRKKLCGLENNLSTPISSSAMSNPVQQDIEKVADRSSAVYDSGYASLVSTPDSNKKFDERTIFNRKVPDDLKDRFFDIKLLYTRPLWEAVSKRKANPGDISMKLRYMGESEESAQLHIIIQCDRSVSKRVRKFFAQEHVVRELGSDFKVHIIDRGLIRLADITTNVEVFGRMGTKKTFCGMEIEMTLGRNSARATLGGLIVASTSTQKMVYGLTAYHPLAKLRPTHPSAGQPSLFEGEDDSDYSSSDANISFDDRPVPPPRFEAITQDDWDVNGLSEASHVGIINGNSLQSFVGSYDWAVVQINCENWMPNCLELPSQSSEVGMMTADDGSATGRELFCSAYRPKSFPGEVVVITNRGLQRGRLEANDSCIMMEPGRVFVYTLDFLPHDGSDLKTGDSGSWVVSEATGEVYGHIVALDALGEAHVMPIQETLREVREHLGVEKVSLFRKADALLLPRSTALADIPSSHVPNEVSIPILNDAVSESSSQLQQYQASEGRRNSNPLPFSPEAPLTHAPPNGPRARLSTSSASSIFSDPLDDQSFVYTPYTTPNSSPCYATQDFS